ncbi:hypothetical protein FGIG_03585 [Fasciola gigantica]|uniref:Uncharacterized protein n=1 Tax=Fasciola gigantica TaxID=46835 RepID=A0A504YGK9_FASGI|nr:hypothetical protein FGIG_03585 [Fasciola gigantica]
MPSARQRSNQIAEEIGPPSGLATSNSGLPSCPGLGNSSSSADSTVGTAVEATLQEESHPTCTGRAKFLNWVVHSADVAAEAPETDSKSFGTV